MSFRKTTNKREGWKALIVANRALLSELPAAALTTQDAFYDYVSKGVHRDISINPSIAEISAKARHDLFIFMNDKAQLDMDVACFDDFNEAFRRDHS